MRNLKTYVYAVIRQNGKVLFQKKENGFHLPGGELKGGEAWIDSLKHQVGSDVSNAKLTGIYSDCPGVAACFLVEGSAAGEGEWTSEGDLPVTLSPIEKTMLQDALEFSGSAFVR